MESWYKVDVGSSDLAITAFDRLDSAFMNYAKSVRGAVPTGFGVFSLFDRSSDRVTWFFSPEAVPLAELFNAQPCEKPFAEEGFSLALGTEQSSKLNFPEYFGREAAK